MTVFLFDVLLSFLIFLRLISVFGFQGTTLTDISVIQAFCLDHALATFGCSFLSRFKYFSLRLRISESKLSYALPREKRLNGDGEIRTLDPLLARQVLSQLSYAPMLVKVSSLAWLFFSFISRFN